MAPITPSSKEKGTTTKMWAARFIPTVSSSRREGAIASYRGNHAPRQRWPTPCTSESTHAPPHTRSHMTAKSRWTLAASALVLAIPGILFAQTAAPPKIEDVAKAVADNTTSINFVWVLVAGFLVMFMQAG